MNKITIIMLIIGGVINSFAQVNTKTFDKNKAFEHLPEFKISQKQSPVLTMPKFNIAAMLEEDKAVKGMDVPFRFGKGFDVNYTLKDSYWENTNNGRIWSLSFKSEGAYSINFIFSELFLPEGGELYIYNTEGTMVYGPVTSKQNLKKGAFLTDLIQGDVVTIHIFEPEVAKNKTRLTISKIVHAYIDTYRVSSSALKSAGSCNNNVDCYSNWEEESDGVAMILLSDGTEWCSGGLVNNTANDYTPYFLTANHCLNGSQTSWMFKFGFRDYDCGGMNYTATSYNGADLISSWNNSDFALLRMDDSPVGNGNITFLGWDNRDNTPTSGTGIHHPSGDYMKISFENDNLLETDYLGSTGNSHWRVMNWDSGVTENGSSGSPLFDQNSRIVGQLHGGFADCSTYTANGNDFGPDEPDWYGCFHVSWTGNNTNATQLEHWLDPNSTGASTTNLLRSPTFSGPYVICYSGCTYTMLNPPNTTISWGGTNVSYPNGNTGTSVTVRASTSSIYGNGTVTASFTVNGIPYTITHPVWVGKFESTFVTGQAAVCPDSYYTYTAQVPGGHSSSYSYSWTKPANWSVAYQNQNYIRLKTPMYNPDYGTVRVSITNDCGTSGYSGITVYPGYCGRSYSIILSPNPTAGETTLTIESTSDSEESALKSASTNPDFDENEEWELEIYSDMQMLKEKKTKLKGKSTKIKTHGWKEGVYIVRVKYKNEILTEKLVVKK